MAKKTGTVDEANTTSPVKAQPSIEETVLALEKIVEDIEGRLTGTLAAFIQNEREATDVRHKAADDRDERRTKAIEAAVPFNQEAAAERDRNRTCAIERHALALENLAGSVQSFVQLYRDFADPIRQQG
jgi:hypothetical protein